MCPFRPQTCAGFPFPDDSFDVVLSRAAIHNVYSAADRATTIREIARVLKRGGRAVIADIRHHGEYKKAFVEAGCTDVRLLDSRLVSIPMRGWHDGVAQASNTMLARKAVLTRVAPDGRRCDHERPLVNAGR